MKKMCAYKCCVVRIQPYVQFEVWLKWCLNFLVNQRIHKTIHLTGTAYTQAFINCFMKLQSMFYLPMCVNS